MANFNLNPITGKLDLVGDLGMNTDGGFANSVYLAMQKIDGGGA